LITVAGHASLLKIGRRCSRRSRMAKKIENDGRNVGRARQRKSTAATPT
jgi:hypothetical protein